MQSPAQELLKRLTTEARGIKTQVDTQEPMHVQVRLELLRAAQAKDPRDPGDAQTTASGTSSPGGLAIVLGSVSVFQLDRC